MRSRFSDAAAAATAVLFALLCLAVAREKNLVFDGGSFLYGGLVIKRTGNPDVGIEHPHLFRHLLAWSVDSPRWEVPYPEAIFDLSRRGFDGLSDLYLAIRVFERVNPEFDELLFRARVVVVAINTLGLLALYAVLRGVSADRPLAALLLAVYATTPAIVGHAWMETTDLFMVTELIFAFACYRNAARRQSSVWHAAGSLAMAAAMTTRFTAGLFFGGALLWTLVRPGPSLLGRALQLAVALGLPFLLVWVVYLFDARPYPPGKAADDVEYFFGEQRSPETGEVEAPARWSQETRAMVAWWLPQLPLPTMFLRSCLAFLEHAHRGHPSYLFGEVAWTGRWYYFPVVFLLKTPLPTVALCAFGVGAWIAGFMKRLDLRALRANAWLAGPLVALAMFVGARVNEGHRHVLWWYPLALLAVAALARPATMIWLRRAASVCLAYQLVILAVEFPHYMEFMDYPWGGPAQEWRYLGNCNLDVGQDVHLLDRELRRRGIQRLTSYLWTMAEPPYGTPIEYHRMNGDFEGSLDYDVFAWSEGNRTYNQGLLEEFFHDHGAELEPAFRVGYTIRVFHIRKAK